MTACHKSHDVNDGPAFGSKGPTEPAGRKRVPILPIV